MNLLCYASNKCSKANPNFTIDEISLNQTIEDITKIKVYVNLIFRPIFANFDARILSPLIKISCDKEYFYLLFPFGNCDTAKPDLYKRGDPIISIGVYR
jgi:hypothetical protein